MSLSGPKRPQKRPKPWLRKIVYNKAVMRDDKLVYGYYDDDDNFIERSDGLDFKTEERVGYFEHWGVDFIKPMASSDQLVQITVAIFSDIETGEVIKVNDLTSFRFI